MESKYFNQVKGEGIRFIQKPLDYGYSASIEAGVAQHEEEKTGDTRKKSKKGGSKSKSATKQTKKAAMDQANMISFVRGGGTGS